MRDVVPSGKPVRPRALTLWLLQLTSRFKSAFSLTFIVGAILLRQLLVFLRQREVRLRKHRLNARIDFGQIQACLLSTRKVSSHGTVEKRTFFVKDLSEIFINTYIAAKVIDIAQSACAEGDPFFVTHMAQDEKWQVLNTCTNHLSSLFACYHVFFNEARRVPSHYKSCWYCFTMTCHQSLGGTPDEVSPKRKLMKAEGSRHLESEDFNWRHLKSEGMKNEGMKRIRIIMVSEADLRDIASGAIEPPREGMVSLRHEERWKILVRFADLFQRQLTRVTGEEDAYADWGQYMCGSLKPSHYNNFISSSTMGKTRSSHQLYNQSMTPSPSAQSLEYEREDNCFLRLHVPYPGGKKDVRENCETHSKDVVLFE